MRLGPEHPLCMDAEMARLWWEADRTVAQAFTRRPVGQRRSSPCDDCNREFAESMRAVNRCDGLYPGEPIPEPEPMPNDWRRREGYATEEERYEARLATMRRAGRRYRNNLKRRAATA